MTEQEVKTLVDLLEKYFSQEFKFFRGAHGLVYGDKFMEDQEPENLFLGVITADHPYGKFIDQLEEDLIDHIKHVFILKNDPHRFKK